MRTPGILVIVLSSVALFAGMGCSTKGFTPTCKPDLSDCLEPATGGNFFLDGSVPDAVTKPDAEASVPESSLDVVSEEPDDVQASDTQPAD
jgi:hypothetical protein